MFSSLTQSGLYHAKTPAFSPPPVYNLDNYVCVCVCVFILVANMENLIKLYRIWALGCLIDTQEHWQ
jgi:hypothetical protein